MNLVFAGTPPFAVPALRVLAARHRVLRVWTRPDRPSGRGRLPATSAVKNEALELGLPVSEGTAIEAASWLASEAADVLVVVAFGILLPQEILSLPIFGALNIHASLLPRWRGAAPIARAIEAGDSETGVSIMQMEAGLDTGPVLRQIAMPIKPTDTSASLQERLSVLGAQAIIETLAGLADGTLTGRPQDPSGVTYARKLAKGEAWIDWNTDAETIGRRIRAFNPYPVAMTRCRGRNLRVWEADVETSGNYAPPGTILGLDGETLRVQTGQGVARLRCLQVEGSRTMDGRAFVNGYRVVPNERLGT